MGVPVLDSQKGYEIVLELRNDRYLTGTVVSLNFWDL